MLRLVSHHLCPYVQRAVISLTEKGVPFERAMIDLANKPDWFKAISPLGKVPLLEVEGHVLFESVAILEYLEDTVAPALHPAEPLIRAEHRGWIEFGSVILNDIAGFYSAADGIAFEAKRRLLRQRFERVEARLVAEPWFDGALFSLVDAVFGPVFRYFDVFDEISAFGILDDLSKIRLWRQALSERASVRDAAPDGYSRRLVAFLRARDAWISRLIP